MNITSFESYFSSIAVAHRELNYFAFGKDRLLNENIAETEYPALMVEVPIIRPIQQGETYIDVYETNVFVLLKLPQITNANESNAFNSALSIIRDIRNRLITDRVVNTQLTSRVGRISPERNVGSANVVGYSFTLSVECSTDLIYDPAKWN